jgi:hypothetical protein
MPDMEVGLEVNSEKIMCMSISRHQTTGRNHYIYVAKKSIQNMENIV